MVKAKSISRQTLLCVLAISFFYLVINPVNALAQPATPIQSTESHKSLIYLLLGGLAVLLIALVFVIIYMLKMFKRRF